jgi:ATP-dependent DNA ligase
VSDGELVLPRDEFSLARAKWPQVTCQTFPVNDLDEVDFYYDQFLEQGYEGLIFRTDTPYRYGSAGRTLMKYKPVKHAEFICLAVWEGTGKNVGVPVYRLQRPDVPTHLIGDAVTSKNTFGCVPKGTYEEKRALWDRRHEAIGKPYTIECADFYDSGVPQFPIGIGVRDYE